MIILRGRRAAVRLPADPLRPRALLPPKWLEMLFANWWLRNGALDDPDRIAFKEGVFKADEKSIDWQKACRLMTEDHLSFTANEDGDYWKPPTGSEAVQFADVSVDVETGIIRVNKVVALQNVGLPVNRHTIENQITGAVIQGLSFCLFEDRILNRQTGAMVNPNMDMYKIAGPLEVPEIIPVIWREERDVGVNSLGEPPVVPTPGAIATAVANAIGTPVRSMPLTPDKVLAAVAAAKEKSSATKAQQLD